MRYQWHCRSLGMLALALGLTVPLDARADEPRSFLEPIKKHQTLASSVPDNGDQNPYALVVAPVSVGKIQKDDVLIDNFNNLSNLQGTGTTIVDYNPVTKRTSVFAVVPLTSDVAVSNGGPETRCGGSELKKLLAAAMADAAGNAVWSRLPTEVVSAACRLVAVSAGVAPMVNWLVPGGEAVVACSVIV